MKKLNEQGLIDFLKNNLCSLDLVKTKHYSKQVKKRGIIQSDILYILKNPKYSEFEYVEKSTRNGSHKYKLCSKTPNSGGRIICIVVIPGSINHRKGLKLITVMWQDAKGQWNK